MASDREYLEYILDQLSLAEEVRFRPMMGEYILYCRDRVIGGIYDNRFLIKPVKAVLSRIPKAKMEIPYEGAKEMVLIEELENREFLKELIEAAAEEIPLPKTKKQR